MYDPILGNHPLSIVENVCPSFDDMIEWDVRSISSEFVLWMCDEHAQTGSTSLVGILSSSAFESMLSKLVGGALSRHLKLLVKLTSFLYSSGGQASYADCDSSTLWSLRSFAGTRVLQDLVLALCNASLAAALLEKLTALFLVLFATIIAVGYTEPRRPSGDLDASTWGLPAHQLPTSTGSCTSGPSAESFSEAKKHLLCILAHHLVYIADRLNLLKPNVSRKHIIEGSACRWNRRATFQWNEMPLPKIADTQSSGASSCDTQDQTRRTDGTLPTRYPACCYHLSRSHSSRSSCKLAGGFGTCVHEPSLNIEPSPMDHLLANYPQMISPPLDVQAPIERISTQIGPESSTSPSHPTHRCSSDHLPPITARDGNYAAFERLAETDGMCAPFLCTDDDDNESNNNIINDINEASNMTGPSALTTSPSPLTTTTSTTDESPQSPSTATHSPQSSASTTTYAHNNNNTSTHAHTNNSIPNNQAEPICRSCNFAPLPFATLDQNDLCQFCSALPFPQCSVSSSENTSLLPSFSSPSTTSEMPDLELLADDGWGCGNLLV